jgi:hypothetical protein
MKVKEQQELRETAETWLISKVYASSKGHGDKFRYGESRIFFLNHAM